MARFEDYPFEIRPLSAEEGSGYVITSPDLPGCMSDGDTPEEALRNGKEAFNAWIAARLEWRKGIPEPIPSTEEKVPTSVSRTVHRLLMERAEKEGVSIAVLMDRLLSEGLRRGGR